MLLMHRMISRCWKTICERTAAFASRRSVSVAPALALSGCCRLRRNGPWVKAFMKVDMKRL